ncbi:MAG: hypothetical protein H3C31_09560 [Brumimicrobium sp.]|nr:hypothetical protein [Brumimicrobium sp.]MCO5269184.1 hypothetical protein [Brumimicrobium sp.]
MKNLVICLFILIASILSSCNVKDIEKYNPDFKGEWRTNVFFYPSVGDSIRNFITINGNDSGFGVACDKNKPYSKCLYLQAGKMKYNKASKALQIGNSVDQIHYVDKEPFINNGNWEMIIDSVHYYKY